MFDFLVVIGLLISLATSDTLTANAAQHNALMNFYSDIGIDLSNIVGRWLV